MQAQHPCRRTWSGCHDRLRTESLRPAHFSAGCHRRSSSPVPCTARGAAPEPTGRCGRCRARTSAWSLTHRRGPPATTTRAWACRRGSPACAEHPSQRRPNKQEPCLGAGPTHRLKSSAPPPRRSPTRSPSPRRTTAQDAHRHPPPTPAPTSPSDCRRPPAHGRRAGARTSWVRRCHRPPNAGRPSYHHPQMTTPPPTPTQPALLHRTDGRPNARRCTPHNPCSTSPGRAGPPARPC